MKRIFCTFFFGLLLLHALGQSRLIDSLRHLLHRQSAPAIRLQVLLALCNENESLPEDSWWTYALQAKALAAHLKDSRARTRALLAQASAYIRWKNPDSARALI